MAQQIIISFKNCSIILVFVPVGVLTKEEIPEMTKVETKKTIQKIIL